MGRWELRGSRTPIQENCAARDGAATHQGRGGKADVVTISYVPWDWSVPRWSTALLQPCIGATDTQAIPKRPV